MFAPDDVTVKEVPPAERPLPLLSIVSIPLTSNTVMTPYMFPEPPVAVIVTVVTPDVGLRHDMIADILLFPALPTRRTFEAYELDLSSLTENPVYPVAPASIAHAIIMAFPGAVADSVIALLVDTPPSALADTFWTTAVTITGDTVIEGVMLGVTVIVGVVDGVTECVGVTVGVADGVGSGNAPGNIQ
jgi:hypothetical protein